MIKKVFTVYDSAIQVHKDTFLCLTTGEARRSWMQAVSDKQLPFHQSPADYTLFEIGTYDDHDGAYTMYKAKINLGTAREALAQLKEEQQHELGAAT